MAKAIDIQDIIKCQQQQFYAVISQERENRVKARNWAVTVILAYIAVLGSGKVYITQFAAYLIPITMIFIFWMIEGLHQSLVLINQDRVILLEKILSSEKLPVSLSIEHHYAGGYSFVSPKKKFKAFLLGCFTSEIIVFFYISMIVVSCLFVYFVYPIKIEANIPLFRYSNSIIWV